VQAFYARKLKEGLSPSTVIYYHSVLHNALATAVKWGLVARNVCDLVTPPRKARFEIQPFTAEQVQRFLDASRGHKWEALFTLALATGMRQGELLGLKWQGINFSTGTLQVRRVLTRIPALARAASPQICALGIDPCLPLADSGLAPCSQHSFAHHHGWAGAGLDPGGILPGEHARE
jgi:integrase